MATLHCAGAVVGGTTISFSLLTSICQFGNFLADKWRRACFVKWSLLMNRRLHIGQANFFSPVCVLRWRDSSSERANLLSQPFQLQLNGFSPTIQATKSRAMSISFLRIGNMDFYCSHSKGGGGEKNFCKLLQVNMHKMQKGCTLQLFRKKAASSDHSELQRFTSHNYSSEQGSLCWMGRVSPPF